MKILICYDGSDSAQNALEYTVKMFKSHNPEIILLTVSEDPADASLENEAITEEVRHEGHDILKKGADWVATHGMDVDAILAHGESREMIMETIDKKKPDIVVVARQKKSGYIRHFLSSVSAYLVRNAGCHLLVMGPK